MEPKIETIAEKKLIGKRLVTSLSNDETPALWRAFMPRRTQIQNPVSPVLYGVQVYDPAYFSNFNPGAQFQKWAALEVANFDELPQGLETLTLPGGLYAVFLHRGSTTNTETFRYIFTSWLPRANYVLDDRPHFELLDERYKNGAPDSEEEIWIPIKPKA